MTRGCGRRARLLVLALTAFSARASAQTGGPYDLQWNTIDGGGGPTAAGTYRVDATIGQPDAGSASGGSVVLGGGFWGGIGGVAVATPTATVTRTAAPTPTAPSTAVPTAPGTTPTPGVTPPAATHTPGSNPTASRSPSPTSTATVPRATASPTPSPTPPACAGDCDQGGSVTVNELIKGVTIALGTTAVDACPSFDTNGDDAVTINEVIAAVNRALNGCADAAAPSGEA